MNEFLTFFDDLVKRYPLHLQISYSKICEWTIRVTKQGCGENGNDLVLVDAESCDMALCFAMAQIQLKNWLSMNEGGY